MVPGSSEASDEAPHVFATRVLGLAIAYVAAGWLGFQVASYNENASLIWPPTGIALAALVVWGRRLCVGVWLGAFLVNWLNDLPWSVSMGIATGNSLMAIVGAQLMLHVFDFRSDLDRVRDVVLLVLVGGALAAVFSSSIGVAALWLSGLLPPSEVVALLSIWWRGDVLGVVAFAPPLLLLRGDEGVWRRIFRDGRFWMLAGLAVVLLVLAYASLLPIDWARIPARLVIPLLVWAAFSLGARAFTLLFLGVLIPSVAAIYLGVGPMARLGPVTGNEQLWIYLMINGCVSLAVAAVVAQRDAARAQHERELRERLRIERAQAITGERDRILREMHDGIGGQLTSTLSMVERGEATNEEIAESLRRTLDEMRIMIDAFEPGDMAFPILVGRLRARIEPLLRRNGLRAAWRVESLEALEAFEPDQALHLLRIIQESITNVVRHANATQVEIRASVAHASDPVLTIEIIDDGTGPQPGSTGGGRGMRNMKARAQALGAEIRFEPRQPGYAVSLVVPVPAAT